MMKKACKNIYFLLLWQAALIGGLFIIAYMLGMGVTYWLHTKSGQSFVQAIASTYAKPQGVRLDHLSYTYVARGTYDVNVRGFSEQIGHPFTVSARIKSQSNAVNVTRLKLNLPELSVNGNLSWAHSTDYVTGLLKGKLNSLEPYTPGQKLDPLSFNINLKPHTKAIITANSAGYSYPQFDIKVDNIALEGIFENQIFTLQSLTLSDPAGGALNLSGTAHSVTQNLNMQLTTQNFMPQAPHETGKLNSQINITGTPDNLKASINANSPEYKNDEYNVDLRDMLLKGEFKDNRLNIHQFAMKDPAGGLMQLVGQINIVSQLLDLKLITQNFAVLAPYDTGKLDSQILITGTPDNLHASVNAQSPSYTNKELNIDVRDIILNAEVKQDNLTITQFTLNDTKEGTLSVTGQANITNQAPDLDIKIREFSPQIPYVEGKIDADLNFSGKPEHFWLKGEINPKKIDVALPDQFDTTINEVNISQKGEKPAPDFTKTLGLDLKIDMPNQIFVRGLGLDAEFGGTLGVKGFANDPQIDGQIKMRRGRFSQFGKKFDITKANFNFSGSVPPSPELDIVTETDTGEYTAQILITGQAIKPEINFASIPALPEDEVMAQILFGGSVDDLSPLQAAQLAQSLAKLSGAGGGAASFDPLGSIRNTIGLDDLDVSTDSEGNVTVGVEKRINDKVNLELDAGSTPGSAKAKVEIQLTPNLTLESEVGQDSSGGAGIFWEWDY